MVVQHNLTAMNSNRMLGITSKSQAKSTEKLSSGYKINRAADDAAGLSISEKMRKQIRGLTQASSNAQDGISAVQTAEGALTEVHDMLQRMNELAVKAANGTNSETDRSYIQNEIDQLITEIDRVSETTKFNETYLLKGDNNAEAKINFQYQAADVTSKDLWYFTVDSTGATKAEKIEKGTYKAELEELAAKGYTFYEDENGDSVAEQINTANTSAYFDSVAVTYITATDLYLKNADGDYVKVNSGDVYETSNSGNYYKLSTSGSLTSYVAVQDSTASTLTSSGYAVKDGATVYDSNGKAYEAGTVLAGAAVTTSYFGAVSGEAYKANTTVSVDTTAADLYSQSAVQFVDKDGNEIAANGLYQYLNEDGTLKAGSGLMLKGAGGKLSEATADDVAALVNTDNKYSTGALTLTLHVGSDATKNNQISLELDAMSAVGLGIDKVKVDGSDDTNALNAIETIAAAIQRVSTQRSALGAVQNRLEHTINNLDNVVENTTSAESQIRDTDMATEMVKYSNNNILAQAGQAMLAQSNQANQGVLSLLG